MRVRNPAKDGVLPNNGGRRTEETHQTLSDFGLIGNVNNRGWYNDHEILLELEAMKGTDRLILGHMPFLGVSYQSEELNVAYRQRFFDTHAISDVLQAAITFGVRRFACAASSSSSLSLLHLQALQQLIDEHRDMELFPCIEIPLKLGDTRIDTFRRWATYIELEQKITPTAKHCLLNDPILNLTSNWTQRMSNHKPYTTKDCQQLSLEWNEIDATLGYFAQLPVRYIEFGSETDFLAMNRRFDLLGSLMDRAHSYGFPNVLFGAHHAGVTIPWLDDNLAGLYGYVTPLNLLGTMMFPTQTLAETAVQTSKKAIYAIKPLAGGRLRPRRAFSYVFRFTPEGCMIGVGSVAELAEDVDAALSILDTGD